MSARKKLNAGQNRSAIIVDKSRALVCSSGLDGAVIQKYVQRLEDIDLGKLEQTLASLPGVLTPLDMKYIVCFSIDMDVAHVSSVFNIEPASVYTVRYRIRKKLRNGVLDFII